MKDFLNSWGLSLAVFLPILGAVVMLVIPKREEHLHKTIALVTSLAVAGIGVLLLTNFDYDAGGALQFVVDKSWIPVINSRYIVGIDGIVNGTASVAKKVSGFVYKVLDQLVVDGVVNGSGMASEESGQILRRIQTGKVQQYGALLFAAAALLAGVFVFVV